MTLRSAKQKTIDLRKKFSIEMVFETLQTFSYHISRIRGLLVYSAHAEFDMSDETINEDLFEFIVQYCENILTETTDGLKIIVTNANSSKFNLFSISTCP